ncbi:Lrp/AsnC family transcriptional regulator [Thalassovita sp.]|uniref:Lrp/AsnC family transcriptional regulator n=1 Tax=Thalassovita sp. TaxID=1979401 RepID=UPI0029DE7F81|nr:Lrp/AsnC family transcriptional regulator [Thalassovita sp.]
MPNPDPVDAHILTLLKRDSRISTADLAEQVGLSTSSCWRRVKALEERGVIRGYTVDLDDAVMGMQIKAIVHVQLARHDQGLVKQFVQAVRTKEEIRACYATTGAADYHLHVVCPDLDAYNRFLEEFLFSTGAVTNAQTNLILRTVKE